MSSLTKNEASMKGQYLFAYWWVEYSSHLTNLDSVSYYPIKFLTADMLVSFPIKWARDFAAQVRLSE